MKKLIFFIPALILFAVSCEKEENSPSQIESEPVSEVKMITEVVSGGRGESTKATISDSDASFAWTAGDNVAVHISNGKYVYTSDDGASGATLKASPDKASFTVVYPDDYSRDAFALYPSTIVDKDATNYGQSEQSLDVTLPSSYTLAQVSGETSPCPMISTNTAGAGWVFYQLCGLLRLTVNDIPATAKRLEIDFNGKKVCGDFSIASPVIPNTSNIDTADDATKDYITVTKDGTDAVLGETSLTINIPLPAGTYNKISVIAYDEISGGNALYAGFVPFARTVDHTNATKKATTLGPIQGTFAFTFKDKDTGNNLGGLRFMRLFSCQNKLYNGETTFGPYTKSRATGEDSDMENPIEAILKFAPDADDQLAFQVIDASGKVYSGLYDVFTQGYSSNMAVDVKAYTFTRSAPSATPIIKAYISPGDLGIDNGVYSFTEPFTNWGQGTTKQSESGWNKRVWFDFGYTASSPVNVYGINDWKVGQKYSGETSYDWYYILHRNNMAENVSPCYRVTIPGHGCCLLLPPDEITYDDLGSDLKASGDVKSVENYIGYLGKGFVLLMSAGRATFKANNVTKEMEWKDSSQGWYWASNYQSNRSYFTWTSTNAPTFNTTSYNHRMHARLFKDK